MYNIIRQTPLRYWPFYNYWEQTLRMSPMNWTQAGKIRSTRFRIDPLNTSNNSCCFKQCMCLHCSFEAKYVRTDSNTSSSGVRIGKTWLPFSLTLVKRDSTNCLLHDFTSLFQNNNNNRESSNAVILLGLCCGIITISFCCKKIWLFP